MKSKTFRFKQFDVMQDKCAMKVNTDGVLLAAWAESNHVKSVLDIGTGTGVLALMLAQKNPTSMIDAIDIDADSFLQATGNFSASKWHHRLRTFHTSLQDFKPDKQYDFIISNPPYFIDDLKASSHKKNIAKHTIELPYTDLLKGIHQLLNIDGRAAIVIPYFNFNVFEKLANRENLFIEKLTKVFAVEGKQAPYLSLIQLAQNPRTPAVDCITIQHKTGAFTEAYKQLTADFYLNF